MRRFVIPFVALLAGAPIAAGRSAGDGPPPEMSEAARRLWNSEAAPRLGQWIGERLERLPEGRRPEWLVEFADLLRDRGLSVNDGWYGLTTGGTRLGWIAARARYDRDGDGRIPPGEWPGPLGDFPRLDRDGDGILTARDFEWPGHALQFTPGTAFYSLADRDGNGKVTPMEMLGLFDRMDGEGMGFLSRGDFERLMEPGTYQRLLMADGPRTDGPPPGDPSRAALIEGMFRQEIGGLWPGPDVGEPAPDFTLRTAEGDREITLSEYLEQSDRPLVLAFGNITCGPFRSQAGNVEELYLRHRDRAGFLMVYVREAHPRGGWQLMENYLQGYTFDQPTDQAGRVAMARACRRTLDFDMPLLVDTIDDRVGTRYSGMPARLYLIGRDGRVAFKGERGPFGFKVGQLEQALILLLERGEPPR